MTWNFHGFYTNTTEGLIAQLKLTEREEDGLKALRKQVRTRIKDVFNEAKQLVILTKNEFSMQSLREQISTTKFRYLSPEEQKALTEIIMQLDEDVRKDLLRLTPRFLTQGSFMYDTLNKPYKCPPQEMDIDDGAYLPMQFFEEKPAIGHTLLLLLVDTSLKSLVAENIGWRFEAKRTCGRIKIPSKNVHIDVPMYAIPYDEFVKKEAAVMESANSQFSGMIFDSMYARDQAIYEQIDSKYVNLAVRADDQKWMISDPKYVYNWFQNVCAYHGKHVRKICRFLKAWRDAQWENGGGPTSISLMAAAVNVLENNKVDTTDFGSIMQTVTEKLPDVYRSGVESPDESDERPLFPSLANHGDKEKEIVKKLEELADSLNKALDAESKKDALSILNSNFGDRVTNSDLIVYQAAAPAYLSEPERSKSSAVISKSMTSA
ncbi:CBASS cGAMP synthase [Acinetobacter sp.]|uniref:CBASS cGAMP synthase n=1 Tax=Acinetobacter sp. TaxID=472 RepID=UPI002898B2F6|nr:CBASS cGAMP synthase [Acinetobacter sp.]